MCLYPKIIKNRKYLKNKKNGGNIPPVLDKRVLYVPVGCGNCLECRKQKARQWQVRLHEEIKENKNGKFVTLTFSNKSIIELSKNINGLNGYELDNEIATLATRRFLERWRRKFKKSVRHWLVTELGQTNTERIHIHGFVWTEKPKEELAKIWKYGRMTIGYRSYDPTGKKLNNGNTGFVSKQSVNYVVKYVTKTDLDHKEYKPKILTSAGIGKGYLQSADANNIWYQGTETKEYYRATDGI